MPSEMSMVTFMLPCSSSYTKSLRGMSPMVMTDSSQRKIPLPRTTDSLRLLMSRDATLSSRLMSAASSASAFAVSSAVIASEAPVPISTLS